MSMTLEEVVNKLKMSADKQCTKWPDGDWHECCVKHDYDYAEGVNKFVADFRLAVCAVAASKRQGGLPMFPIAHLFNGLLMWVGVTLFGWKAWIEYWIARESRWRT